MGDRLTSLAYDKHHILLPQLGPPADSAVWQQNGLRSIFYGEIPCLWQAGNSGTAQPNLALTAPGLFIGIWPKIQPTWRQPR